MKKILCFVWITLSIITMGSVAQADTGIVESDSITQTATAWSQEQFIIADTDNLDTDLTRAQAAQLYLNIAKQQRGTGKIIELMSGNTNTGCIFDDVDNHPYVRIITTACQRGLIINNSDGLFRPDDIITPLDSLVILMKINYGAQDEHSNPRYQSYVNLALKKNIITQSDIPLLISGSSISTNQMIQRAYNAAHPSSMSVLAKIKQALTSNNISDISPSTGTDTARDSDTTTHEPSKRSWKWLRRVLFVFVARILRKLVSNLANKPNRSISGLQPSGIYDDLTIVEGIGPKVQQILYENDILTYDSLSRLTAGHISNIISPYGTTYESMNPVTWPRQAQLARDGKRDELEIFKQELKKGT